MNDYSRSQAAAKRQILAALSSALSALSERMRSQQDAAVKITLLSVRAEQIAERSWDLSHAKHQHFQRESEALVHEIQAFAADVAEAAKRAGEEALLGREVAQAIDVHSQDIARLAQDIDILPDAAAVRARLRPLSQTLTSLPERLKANAAAIKDVNGIVALASGLAERSEKLAAGGMNAYREAVLLSQDLRHFAEEATAISLEMTRGSAMAVKALNEMTAKTVGLSRGRPLSAEPAAAHGRMMSLPQGAPLTNEVWVGTAAKIAPRQIPGVTVWGSAANKKD
jgi:hypothetical protein